MLPVVDAIESQRRSISSFANPVSARLPAVGAEWEAWTPPTPAAVDEAVAPAALEAAAPGIAEAESAAAADIPTSRMNRLFRDITTKWAALPRGRKRLAMAGGGCMLLALMALAITLQLLSSPAKRKPGAAGTVTEALEIPDAPPAGKLKAAPSALPMKTFSNDALAEIFQRQLVERDLQERIDLKMGPNRWELRGSLDSEEEGRLDRMLRSFEKTYRPAFKIDVTLVPLIELLPFRIVEVMTGKGANIVTDAGRRLFVGDTLDGYKLSEIDGNKIVFTGRRRIEVMF